MESKRSFFVWLCIDAQAFNRTSMESKPLLIRTGLIIEESFNRTSMESKLDETPPQSLQERFAFNRTSMESKHENGFQVFNIRTYF